MLCQNPGRGLAICTLVQLWVLVLLFTSIISPAYLVEGVRNTFSLPFPASKESYVYTVLTLRWCYFAGYAVLGWLTLQSLYGYWQNWRQQR